MTTTTYNGRFPLQRKDVVPVQPLRDRYLQLLAKGTPPSEIARKAGYEDRTRNRPDVTRLERRLGVKPEIKGQPVNETVAYRTAVTLCDALDLDYWEADV